MRPHPFLAVGWLAILPSLPAAACWPPADPAMLPDCLEERLAEDPGGAFLDSTSLRATAPDRARELFAAIEGIAAFDDPIAEATRVEALGWLSLARGDESAARRHLERAAELDRGEIAWVARDVGRILSTTPLATTRSRAERIDAFLRPEAADATRPIEAERWRPRLPGGWIEGIDGERFALADPRRGALLLDFWATWCAPCRKELPEIDALYRNLREAGLEAIAVNVDEEPEIARSFIRSLDVELPLAIADPGLVRYLGVESLPVLVLADREGYVVDRWDGYHPGVAREAGARFAELRARPSEPAVRERVGTSLGGAWQPNLRWSRGTGGPALGVAARAGGGIVAAVDGGLIRFGADGRVVDQRKTARYGGRLERDLRTGWVAHREGGTRLLWLGAEGEERRVDIGSPLLDVAVDGDGHGAAATLDGLFLFDVDDPYGGSVARVEGVVSATAVEAIDGAWWVLAPGALLRVTAAGEVAESVAIDSVGWTLVPGADSGRVGVAPEGVIAHATLRLGERSATALGLRDGRLLLVDSAGERLSASRWEPIADLAAVDVDGDGNDELALAHGRRVSLLSWGAAER